MNNKISFNGNTLLIGLLPIIYCGLFIYSATIESTDFGASFFESFQNIMTVSFKTILFNLLGTLILLLAIIISLIRSSKSLFSLTKIFWLFQIIFLIYFYSTSSDSVNYIYYGLHTSILIHLAITSFNLLFNFILSYNEKKDYNYK